MKIRSILMLVAALAMTIAALPAEAQYGGGVVIANGGPVSGVFRPGLPIDPSTNRAYVDYVLTVTVPGSYQVDLVSPNSSAYDPYLYLYQNGRQIASNDDGGGYPNARINRQLAPGTYIVRVSSFRSGMPRSAGHYTLTVQGGGGYVNAGAPVPIAPPGGGQMVMPGVPVSGVFLPSFPLIPGQRRPYVDYVFNVSVPGNYRIDLISANSSAYDPYLYLMQYGRQIATNDDGGGYPNSRIQRFLTPGLYTIRVSSFRGGPVGPAPFTLMVNPY